MSRAQDTIDYKPVAVGDDNMDAMELGTVCILSPVHLRIILLFENATLQLGAGPQARIDHAHDTSMGGETSGANEVCRDSACQVARKLADVYF
jgi:hypothetical protein